MAAIPCPCRGRDADKILSDNMKCTSQELGGFYGTVVVTDKKRRRWKFLRFCSAFFFPFSDSKDWGSVVK